MAPWDERIPGLPQQPGQAPGQGGLLQMITQMLSGTNGGAGGGGPRGPVVSSGMPGQVIPSPQPPRYGGSGGPQAQPQQSGLPAPAGAPSANQPQFRGAPGNALFQSGFEFNSPKGRDAAVVSSAIQGVTGAIDKIKQQKQEKTRAKAESVWSQVVAAQQAGDQQALNLLLEDPKAVKLLEDGLNYYKEMVPTEGASPEAKGMKGALDKLIKTGGRLPAPNTPGGISMPHAPQSVGNQQQIQDLTSGAALNKLKGDPALAANMGLGTSMSGDEQRKAEMGQAGLTLLPAEERKAFLAHQDLFAKMENDNKQLLTELASKEKVAFAGLSSQERQTRMSTGPLYYAANMRKQIADAQIRIKDLYYQGKAGEANKVLMQTMTSQINSLRNNATKIQDKEPEMAKKFLEQADAAQKQFDAIKDSNQMNVDQLLNSILSEP